jgi:hypothetical protein
VYALAQAVFFDAERLYPGQISHKKPNLAFGPYYPEKPNAVFLKSLIY